MHIIKSFIIAVALILAPSSAHATSQAPSTKSARGRTFLMCSSETDTGVCEGTSGDTFVVTDKYDTFTFYLTETGTGSSCDIYATHHLDTPTGATTTLPNTTDLSTFAANKINSSALTLALDKITFKSNFYYMWVSCTALGTTTTVHMEASVGLQRNQR